MYLSSILSVLKKKKKKKKKATQSGISEMCHKRLTWLVENDQRLCCSLRNGRNYKSLERACALLEGRGQEMIDACAVKAKPAKTRFEKTPKS